MSELVQTEDGSFSAFHEGTGELYHNRAGAYTEAFKHYFEASEAQQILSAHGQLRVIDACFGMGYNTFVLLEQLSLSEAVGAIEVFAVETDARILQTTAEVLSDERFKSVRRATANEPPLAFGEYSLTLGGGLTARLHVIQQDLRAFVPAFDRDVHLVFHDPFSPRKVPELWTVDLFQQYHRLLQQFRGKLLTYSTAGAVWGGLLSAGFRIFRTGPLGGKAGGTLASADPRFCGNSVAQRLSDEDLQKVNGCSGVPYRDQRFAAQKDDILRRRTQEQAFIQGLSKRSRG